jgi:hypothetical protein
MLERSPTLGSVETTEAEKKRLAAREKEKDTKFIINSAQSAG